MAEKSGPDETPVELQLKVARTRELVVRDASGLRYELNFPLKLKRAFQRNTVVWVGAAIGGRIAHCAPEGAHAKGLCRCEREESAFAQ